MAQQGAVRRFVGYKAPAWGAAAHILAAVVSGGLSLLACYTWPHLRLWMQQQCPLGMADYVKAELISGQHLVIKVHKCTPPASLSHNILKRGAQPVMQRRVQLLLVVYVYDAEEETFLPVPDMPLGLSSHLSAVIQHLHQISSGATWEKINAIGTTKRRERVHLYGINDIVLGRPSFPKMVASAFSSPMYLIQYGELAYLMYELRYIYAGILYLISFWANSAACWTLYWKRMELYTAIRQCRLVPIVQAGIVRAMSSRRLVPGDVIVVLQGRAPCDMVLLRGSCLVEESMLSGEAAHVRKSTYVPSSQEYHPESHHYCTVHAGTHVQQVWNEEDPEDEVLGMVVRTGLRTTVGNLLRQVMCPVHTAEPHKDTFVVDLLRFYAFAFVLQLFLFMLYAAKVSEHPTSTKAVIDRVINIFISAAPTGAPTVVVAGIAYCVVHLRNQEVVVLLPDKIKTIADVEVVCFDKTGTLTGTMPDLFGVIPVVEGNFTSLQKEAVWWPARLRQAAAVCNSLTFVRKNKVVGDAAEMKMCQAVEAHFVNRNEVTLPLHNRLRSVHTCSLHVLRRFEFDSCLLRSGVVAREHGAKKGCALLFVRGGTSTIRRLLDKQTMPLDYSKVVDQHASQSHRLLALACGVLHNVANLDLASMRLEALEQCAHHMELLGLVVMTNHVRADTKETISHLQDRGAMRTLMVTGPAFAHLLKQEDPSVLELVMHNVVVFARMQSHQKGQVMELIGARGLHQMLDGQSRHIKGLGKVAMYCGDGVNDLAALAAADVGMAVSSSDASAAASVITKQQGIAGTCLVIREARAGQAIKLSAVKYMVVYQIMLTLCSTSAYFIDGSGFSFDQTRILDFMAISMGIVAGVRPGATLLQPVKPPSTLCIMRNYVLICETVLIACIFVLGCVRLLLFQPWYPGGNGQADHNPVTTALWLVACCQVIAPMFSFSADCALFCKSESRPDLIVITVAAEKLQSCPLSPLCEETDVGEWTTLEVVC
ncbi:hypothetical protein WJX82_009387 [Trebouxia sp. C0006]